MQDKGISLINSIVAHWSKKYLYLTTFLSQDGATYKYMCEFSRPLAGKPNPAATVKVYFFVQFGQPTPLYEDHQNKVDSELQALLAESCVTFRFENDSLYHNPRSSVVGAMLEKWIEQYLAQKKMTSQILFLGTEFEKTRINDPRMQHILEQLNYEEVRRETTSLDPELLEEPDELVSLEMEGEEAVQMRVMRQLLYDSFRAMDKLDSGVITLEEFRQVLRLVNIQLQEDRLKELFAQLDKNKNGLADFSEWVGVGGQIVFGIFVSKQLLRMLKVKEEEFLILAIMTLHNDPVHEDMLALVEQYRQADLEADEMTGNVTLKTLAHELAQPKYQLEEIQVEDLVKSFKKLFSMEIPYEAIQDQVVNFKLDLLKNGMMESSYSKIEHYLISIFQPYQDKKRKGFMKLEHLQQALRAQSKIILTNIQLYLLESLVAVDDDGFVNYKIQCRLLGEMIKRFFAPQFQCKMDKFIKMGGVQKQEYMEGWSEQDIIDQALAIKENNDWDGFDGTQLKAFLDSPQRAQQLYSMLHGAHLDFKMVSQQEQNKVYEQYVKYKTRKSIGSFNNL